MLSQRHGANHLVVCSFLRLLLMCEKCSMLPHALKLEGCISQATLTKV